MAGFLFSKAFDIFIFMTYNMWVLGILVLGFKRPSKRVRDDVKSPPTIWLECGEYIE